MVVHKLNFCTACLTIDHTGTCCNTHDELLIERAANSAIRELCDQCGGCTEDTAFRTTHVLSINEETRITLRQFYESFVDCAQHHHLPFRPAWSVLLPVGHIQEMFHHAIRCGFRLL